MNIQEQEHWDYEAGCQSELQNAYELSRMSTDLSGDSDKIRRFVQEGKYVVVERVEVQCKHTDAYIGSYESLIEVCDSREQAEVIFNKLLELYHSQDNYSYLDIYILPRVEVEQFNSFHNTNNEDIPF